MAVVNYAVFKKVFNLIQTYIHVAGRITEESRFGFSPIPIKLFKVKPESAAIDLPRETIFGANFGR
jgi:hypothetical protein